MSDQPPALNNINEAIKDVNNNNDDDKQPSRNSSTSSATETASITSESHSESSDSIDTEESEKKKKEDENYKRKLDGLIKKRMADITTPTDDEENQQQNEVMRKKLEEERSKILQEINERKKTSESKEELNSEPIEEDASLDTPGQLRRRNSPRMSPRVMTRDDDNGKNKGMSIKEVKSSELEEVPLSDAPAGVAPSTPSTPKQLTKSQSKAKTESPRVPMKGAKVISKSSSFVQEVRDALTKKIDTKKTDEPKEPKTATRVNAAMLSRTQSKAKLKEMTKTNTLRKTTSTMSTTDEIDPKMELRAKAKLASIEAAAKTTTKTDAKTEVKDAKAEAKAKFDLKTIPQVGAHLAIKNSSPFKGTIDDHPINHGKRGTYRVFMILVVICTIMYEITALPDTFLSNNPVWWFVLWTTTLYMNLAFLLFLSNFWWRATMKCEQYPEDARPGSTSPHNRFIGSTSLTLFPIAGEGVEMVKKHFGAVYDSHVTGLHRDIMVICDDLRIPTMQDEKEIPCLSSLEPTQGFSEPYLFRAKDMDPKYLEMANQIATDKGLTHKEDQSITNPDGTGYVCWKFYNPQHEQKCFYYFARHKWDNVPSMLKGANLNQAMDLPEVRHEMRNAPSGHSFVFIVDARHQVKSEFKAALLQYFWTWNPDAKQFVYHDKLASVQAQHWYPNIPNGHPLQPNNRFFFDGVMKGRAGRGSTPNAGTMNVFNYQCLYGIDPEYPDEARFCIYSVTEDKATEIEYFCRGYYAIYHPYVVSSGVPANTLAKEFDRLLRWARGNFVILSKRNCVFHSHGMKPLFRLWAIEGTIYPINGLITLLFYFACIIYVAFGVTFLTFHSVTVLVMFLGLMIVGRISYLLSVPTMTQEDMWANMQAWLNTMPVYVWAVFTYYKGFAKNAVWLSTGSKATTDGTKIQWIVVMMQFVNIVSIFLGVGFLFGNGYTDMWEFFARMGLGIMLIVMQHNCVIDILVQNGVLKKDAKLGPVVIFTLFIVVGLIFCLMWQFQVAPPSS